MLTAGLLIVLSATSANTQTWTYRDINPNRSSLDATNPNGASGGRANGLGRAADNTAYYAATEWGGLYRSIDTGRTWTHLPRHVPVVTWDVEVDPTTRTRVYATSWFDGRVASRAGINVSTDAGDTWVHPATATPPAGSCADVTRRDNPSAFGIAIDPAQPTHVFIGTNCGLARSLDAGVTWTFIDPTPADGADDVWDVIVHHGGIIDLCGDDGHRRSTDGGATWTTAATNPLPGGLCSIAASPDERDVLYAVVGTSIFESINGGGSWPNSITNPFPQGRIPFVTTNKRATNFDLWFGDTWLNRAACVTPAAGSVARRCPQNTWTGPFTTAAGAHDDAGDLAFNPGAADACPTMFSSDGGVYRNTRATSPACHGPAWEQPDVTPHALWLYSMSGADQATLALEDIYLGAQDNGAFGAPDGSTNSPTWLNVECCDSHNFSSTNTRVLYTICCWVGSPNPIRIFRRGVGLVGGGLLAGPPGNTRSFTEDDALAHFTANGLVAITSAGIFFTNDVSVPAPVWTQLGAATTPAGAQNVYVSDSTGTPFFFVQAGNGNGVTQDRLFFYRGTAAGGAWTRIRPPGDSGGFGIFAVDRTNPYRLFASNLRTGRNPRMLRSMDLGATWTVLVNLDNMMTGGGTFTYTNPRGPVVFGGFAGAVFQGYPQPTLIATEPGNPNTVLAGAADAGVFLSPNNGDNWSLITNPTTPGPTGAPHLPRPHFAWFDREGSTILEDVLNIYVGTQGRGVWRLTRRISRFTRACGTDFRRCIEPQLERGTIVLDCSQLDFERCRFRDPLPKNCLVKYSCPGCPPGGLCPGFYHLVLDGLDPKVWEVGLFTNRGESFDHEVVLTRTGVVVSFRPDRRRFTPGSIGGYILAFALRRNARPERHVIRASLEVGNDWYSKGRH